MEVDWMVEEAAGANYLFSQSGLNLVQPVDNREGTGPYSTT